MLLSILLALDLESYLKAVERHPAVEGSRHDYEAQRYRGTASVFPPSPILTFNAMYMPGAVALSQPLPPSWPLLGMAERDKAEAQRYSYEAFKNSFLLSAIDTYLRVLYLNRELEVIDSMLNNLQRMEVSSQALYRAGKVPLSHLQRVRARIRILEARRETVEAEREGWLSRLEYFYGGDVDSLKDVPDSFRLPPYDSLLVALDSSPSVRASRKMVEAASKRKVAALLSAVPVVSPGVLYMDGNLSFSVSVGIPLWLPSYLSRVKEEERRYEGAFMRRRNVEEGLRSTLMKEYKDYVASLERFRILMETKKDLQEALRSEESRYRTSPAVLTDYLMVLNQLLEVELEEYRAKLSIVRGYYAVMYLLGFNLGSR